MIEENSLHIDGLSPKSELHRHSYTEIVTRIGRKWKSISRTSIPVFHQTSSLPDKQAIQISDNTIPLYRNSHQVVCMTYESF